MILSIGMIVKNEEKYLKKCLEALKPILDNVDSELIIADTGSTDKTVEIAKNYTDNVYHFEWVNDFSAARNSTLERAKGEWYMFIDADEILQSCDDLINFFNSGEYKKYCTASFVQRNYTVASKNGIIDRSIFQDFFLIRLTVRQEKIYFESPIHEHLNYYINPIKKLNVIADHYGYVFFNKEDAIKKSERNLKLLLDKLEAYGEEDVTNDPLIYKEISDAYSLVNNKEKEKEYIDLGLKKLDHHNLRIVSYYKKKAVLLYFDDKKYEELLEICEEYFNKEKNPSRKTRLISDITMYAYKGRAEYELNRYGEAASDFCDFFDIYDDYINNRLNAEDDFLDSMYIMEIDIHEIYLKFLKSCIREKKYSLANKYLKFFNISGKSDDIDYMRAFAKMTVSVMVNSAFNNLSYIYNQLDEHGKDMLAAEVRRCVLVTDSEKAKQLLANLKNASESDSRTADSVTILNGYVNGNVNAEAAENYLKKYGAELNEDIFCILMYKNMDITPFVNAKDYNAKEYVLSVFKILEQPLEMFENYNVENISKEGLEKSAETYKYAMIKAMDKTSSISQLLSSFGILKKTDISKLLKKYALIGKKYCLEYGEEKMPWEIRPARIAERIIEYREAGKYDDCLSELQRLIMLYPEFDSVLEDYRENVKKEKPAALSEFDQMAMQVKQNIRAMINKGNFADALEVLKEFQTLCPNDGEAEMLRNEIMKNLK